MSAMEFSEEIINDIEEKEPEETAEEVILIIIIFTNIY